MIRFFFLFSVSVVGLLEKKKKSAKIIKYNDQALRNDFRPRFFFVGMQNVT